MARKVNLNLSIETTSSANPRAALSSISFKDEYEYTSQSLDVGLVPAGGAWFTVPFGDMATAKLVCLSLGISATVRLNGTEEIANTTYLQIRGDITGIEIAQGALPNEYSAQLFS